MVCKFSVQAGTVLLLLQFAMFWLAPWLGSLSYLISIRALQLLQGSSSALAYPSGGWIVFSPAGLIITVLAWWILWSVLAAVVLRFWRRSRPRGDAT